MHIATLFARTFTILVVGWSFSQAAIQWQVTHGQMARGQCRLTENSIKATLHETHLDIEEEAVIQTLGSSTGGGDPNSLEIYGDFALDPEAAVVGMLLWNGSTILKAKLKGKIEANQQYEDVVDRSITPPPRPRDPAVIESMGKGRYGIKIYPVQLGKSRKIRIRYLLPLNTEVRGQLGFELKSIFRGQLPGGNPELRLASATGATGVYLSINNEPRQVALPSADIIGNADRVMLFPKNSVEALFHETTVSEGKRKGRYLNLYAAVPQEIRNWPVSGTPSVMAVLKAGDREYKVEPRCKVGASLNCVPLSFHAKSAALWEPNITWVLYNQHGQEMMRTTSTVRHLRTENDLQQTILWAASVLPYAEDTEDFLGLKYGFVDRYVSLLALEEDILDPQLQPVYAWEGVPLLSEEDIIAPDTARYAFIADPDDSDPGRATTGLLSERLSQRVTPGITLFARLEQGVLQLPESFFQGQGGELEIELLDLSGSVVSAWRLAASGPGFSPQLPLRGLRPGIYLLRIRGQGPELNVARVVIR